MAGTGPALPPTAPQPFGNNVLWQAPAALIVMAISGPAMIGPWACMASQSDKAGNAAPP